MLSIKKKCICCEQGFTLVELLVAMVVASIVFAAIYSVYVVQQRHYIAQTQVAEMQQNIRAAMNLIMRDIRMAGYDETGNASATIEDIQTDLIYMTIDLNEDGDVSDPGEHIAYDLYVSPTSGLSTLGRAINNTTIAVNNNAGHYTATNHQPAAQVIEALQFAYFDEDNSVTANANAVRSVVVSMLARAEIEDRKFVNGKTYPIGGPWPKQDHYRRRYHQMTIQCRNMGL